MYWSAFVAAGLLTDKPVSWLAESHGRRREKLPVAVDVTPVLVEFLDGNRGPDPGDPERRRLPNYGVVATLSGGVLEVELTFRSGSAYCCSEWRCHLALTDGKRWDRLRQLLAAYGIAAPPPPQLNVACVVEDGAVFFDFARPDRGRRGWYGFASVAASRYQAAATEAPSPTA
jgi:hypothetical protein